MKPFSEKRPEKDCFVKALSDPPIITWREVDVKQIVMAVLVTNVILLRLILAMLAKVAYNHESAFMIRAYSCANHDQQ
jgi:hypothetical protein